MKLQVIVGSTRPGRQTLKFATWIANEAKKLPDTEVELVDLADYELPFFDEIASPRYNQHREINAPAQKWLAKLQEGDAYIVATPEYNASIPGVLKNALDYTDWQLSRKPAAIAAHGAYAGARAATQLKVILSEGQAVVIPKMLTVHGASEAINEAGELREDLKSQPYGPQASLDAMLQELIWYARPLKAAREQK